MQTLSKFVSSVSDFYKEINPSTLSGAIDVIVAERPDGVLACSPFHVRFGKMQLLRPQEKFVEFKVNDRVIDIPMKLGDGGEAFFVVETDKFVPEELRTSPLVLQPEDFYATEALQKLDLDFQSPGDAAGFDFEKEMHSARMSNSQLYPMSDSELEIQRDQVTKEVMSDSEMDYNNQLSWSWENPPLTANSGGVAPMAVVKEQSAIVKEQPVVSKDRQLRTVENRNIDLKCLKDAVEGLLDGKQGELQMSLCGQMCHDEKLFAECAVTAEIFAQNPISVLQDEQLVFKINGKFYTWHVLAPLFVSRMAFGKELLQDEVLQSLAVGTSMLRGRSQSPSKTNSNAEPQKLNGSSSSWKQWWNTRSNSPEKLVAEQPNKTQVQASIKLEPINTKERSETMHRVQKPAPIEIDRPLSAPVSDQDVKNVAARQSAKQNYAKTLRLTSDQLKSLPLSYGPNNIQFSVVSSYSGNAVCTARIFLWRYDVNIVVSDIDGTITKSDALGHLLPILRFDWTHQGIANLYTNVRRNGYEILYLTSRAIGQADTTRGYLKGIEQEGQVLPDGPVIMSPDRLIAALKREVIYRRPEEFKIAVLKDIKNLFDVRNPFYAGFGNRVTDAMSYRAVDIPAYRIYSIDSSGQIKMDFFAGYSSSYIKLADLVDHIFPPIKTHRRSLSTMSMDVSPGTPSIGRFGARQDSVVSQNVPAAIEEESVEAVDGAYTEGAEEMPAFDPEVLKDGYDDFAYWRNDSFFDIPLPEHIETSKQETAIAHIKDPAQRHSVLHDLPQHSGHISKRKTSKSDSVSSGSSVADEDDSDQSEVDSEVSQVE